MATSTSLARGLAALSIGLAAVALSGCSLLNTIIGSANPSGTSTDGADVFTIKVGDCLNDGGATGVVTTVPVIDCAKPHDSEAYKSIIMKDASFPGDTEVTNQAESGCKAGFETFAGIKYDDSTLLNFSYYYPTSDSWKNGDREILCLMYSIDAKGDAVKTTGSLKGAAK